MFPTTGAPTTGFARVVAQKKISKKYERARGGENTVCEKKILRRFFRTIFLESFKVKIESVTVIWIFLYLNTIRFQCLAAHSKAKIEF